MTSLSAQKIDPIEALQHTAIKEAVNVACLELDDGFGVAEPDVLGVSCAFAVKLEQYLTALLIGSVTSAPGVVSPEHTFAPKVDLNHSKFRAAIKEAVRAACIELADDFEVIDSNTEDGASPFELELERFIKSLLLGPSGAASSLLANRTVFGEPFELPAVRGCGYLVKDLSTGYVLSDSMMQFIPAILKQVIDGQVVTTYPPDSYVIHYTHDGAAHRALTRLRQDGTTPAQRNISIVAAVWSDLKRGYIECPLEVEPMAVAS